MSQHGMSTPQGCSDLSQLSLAELHRRKQALEAEVAKHNDRVRELARDIRLCEWYRRMRERGFADMEPLPDGHAYAESLRHKNWKEDHYKAFFEDEEPFARARHARSVEMLETSEAQLERVQCELRVRKARQVLQLQGEWVLGNAQQSARSIAFWLPLLLEKLDVRTW